MEVISSACRIFLSQSSLANLASVVRRDRAKRKKIRRNMSATHESYRLLDRYHHPGFPSISNIRFPSFWRYRWLSSRVFPRTFFTAFATHGNFITSYDIYEWYNTTVNADANLEFFLWIYKERQPGVNLTRSGTRRTRILPEAQHYLAPFLLLLLLSFSSWRCLNAK